MSKSGCRGYTFRGNRHVTGDRDVPTGRVKWFDAERGFGFASNDDGGEVFVHASALPEGTTTLKPGAKIEFGVAEGRRGLQALSVRLVEASPSVARAMRKPRKT